MSYLQDKIVNFAYIAQDQAVSKRPASGVKVTRTNLAEGTVALTDLENKVITTLPTSGKFKIAYKGPNNDLIWSAPIDGANVTVSDQIFTPEKEQVTFIGFNGTGTDNVPSANATSYHIMLRRTEHSKLRRGVGYDNDITAQFTTPSTGTTAQVWATNMQSTLIQTVNQYVTEHTNESPAYARMECVSDGTVAAFTGTGDMIKLTKGSPVAEFYLSTTGAASTGTIAAGAVVQIPSSGAKVFTFTAVASGGNNTHIIYIGDDVITITDGSGLNTAAQNATAIAAAITANSSHYYATANSNTVTIVYNPCFAGLPPVVLSDNAATALVTVTTAAGQDLVPVKYVVKTGTTAGASFELTVPFQGESGFAAEGTGANNAGVVTVITYWGIKFAGIRNQYDVYRWRDFYKNRFDIRVMRGPVPDGTTITNAISSTVGAGNFPQVAEDEFVSYGNYGRNLMITDMPPVHRPALAKSCYKYSLVELTAKNTVNPELVGGIGVFRQVFKFYLELANNGELIPGSQGDQLATTLVSGFTTGDLDYVA